MTPHLSHGKVGRAIIDLVKWAEKFKSESRTTEAIKIEIGNLIVKNSWIVTGEQLFVVGEDHGKISDHLLSIGWISRGSTGFYTPEGQEVVFVRTDSSFLDEIKDPLIFFQSDREVYNKRMEELREQRRDHSPT